MTLIKGHIVQKKYIATALLLFFQSIYAEELRPNFFYPEEEFLNDQKITSLENIEKAKKSIFRFATFGDSSCTGTWISREGHFITAFHCLLDAISMNKYEGAEQPLLVRKEIIPNIWAQEFLNIDNSNLKFKASSKQTPFTMPSGFSFQIAFIPGKGFIEPKSLKTLEESKNYFKIMNQGYNSIGQINDFVILKATNKTPSNASCLKINKNFEKNESIWSFGFPTLFLRSIPSFSIGKITNGVDDIIGLNEEDMTLYKKIFSPTPLFFSTTKAKGGSSGGPILNTHGEIIGITIMRLTGLSLDTFGSTVSIPLKTIYSTAVKKLGPKKTAELFNCPTN